MHDDSRGGFNPGKHSTAGLYNVLIGGKDHYGKDRKTVQHVSEKWPDLWSNGPANRAFMRRAVEYLAGEVGIRQFLDIGCGKPTSDNANVHQIVRRHHSDARVVYVDNDPAVRPHALMLAGSQPGVAYLEADAAEPDEIMEAPQTKKLITVDEPTALLLVTTLHYISDEERPAELVERYVRDLPSGSAVVISHMSADGAPPELITDIVDVYQGGMYPRPVPVIEELFGGWPLVDPGHLVDIRDWRPQEEMKRSRCPLIAGVAVKP